MLVLTRRREEAESEESYGSEPYVFWEVVGLDFRMCDLFRPFRLLGAHGWQERPASSNKWTRSSVSVLEFGSTGNVCWAKEGDEE